MPENGERDRVREILAPFPREQTWLLPALQRVQGEVGFLPAWCLDAVSEHLRVPRSEVYGVASYYPELRLESPGRRRIRVCTGVSCRINGSREVLAALSELLRVSSGETRSDGEVTLEEVGCCFACSVAPVVEVDGVFRGRVRSSSVAALASERKTP